MRPSFSAFLREGLTVRVIAAALCAVLFAGMVAAQEERPADVTISKDFEAGNLKGLHAALVIFHGETLNPVLASAPQVAPSLHQERNPRTALILHAAGSRNAVWTSNSHVRMRSRAAWRSESDEPCTMANPQN